MSRQPRVSKSNAIITPLFVLLPMVLVLLFPMGIALVDPSYIAQINALVQTSAMPKRLFFFTFLTTRLLRKALILSFLPVCRSACSGLHQVRCWAAVVKESAGSEKILGSDPAETPRASHWLSDQSPPSGEWHTVLFSNCCLSWLKYNTSTFKTSQTKLAVFLYSCSSHLCREIPRGEWLRRGPLFY